MNGCQWSHVQSWPINSSMSAITSSQLENEISLRFGSDISSLLVILQVLNKVAIGTASHLIHIFAICRSAVIVGTIGALKKVANKIVSLLTTMPVSGNWSELFYASSSVKTKSKSSAEYPAPSIWNETVKVSPTLRSGLKPTSVLPMSNAPSLEPLVGPLKPLTNTLVIRPSPL